MPVNVAERRKSDRIPVFQDATVMCHTPCVIAPTQATIIDISKGGMGLVVSVPYTRGSFLKIASKDAIIFAEVRHCRRIGELYRIGVAIETVASRRKEESSSTYGHPNVQQ
jgi:c-di-GMP-binding flagellar brake protein YcgR